MMDKKIMEAIDKTLTDYGVDWILIERGNQLSYKDLMEELELALSKVLD